MLSNRRRSIAILALLAAALCISSAQEHGSKADLAGRTATLWIEPQDIRSLDLYYGPGGKRDQPGGPFTFVKEDDGGTSPKFDVRDAEGKHWKAKMGPEAQPETVATRLMWAVGFITNENYFLPALEVNSLPPWLHRGQEFVNGNTIRGVRLQRRNEGKKIADWKWRHNPFQGTREFNGLRVMMALLSNWDLKDENNAIVKDKDSGRLDYEVSDLGASFGRSGKSYTDSISKHNLPAYRRSKFISKITSDHVDFAFPTHPPFLYVFDLPFFFGRMQIHWIGKHIPRADAKWIGSLLGQLSDQQIEDAFRAGGYSPAEVTAYSLALKARIAELQRL